MSQADINLVLDVFKKRTVFISAKQGDFGSRRIKIKITSNGQNVIVGTTDVVKLNMKRGDGQKQSFTGSANSDGTVIITIPEWGLECVGLVRCDISIYDSTQTTRKLTTMDFYIVVERSCLSDNTGGDYSDPESGGEGGGEVSADSIASVDETLEYLGIK